jgi:hypothetical protein
MAKKYSMSHQKFVGLNAGAFAAKVKLNSPSVILIPHCIFYPHTPLFHKTDQSINQSMLLANPLNFA